MVVIASLMAMLLFSPAVAFAESVTTYTQGALYYTVSDASATITGCFGKDETVEVPASIAGTPVNTIASGAFTENASIKEVILPDTIMTIEEGAFASNITVLQKQGSVSVGTEGTGSTTSNNAGSGQDTATAPGSNTANGTYIVLQQGSSAPSNETEHTDASSSSADSSMQAEVASNGGVAEEQDADADVETNSLSTQKEYEGAQIWWIVAILAIAAAAALSVVVCKQKKKHPKQ